MKIFNTVHELQHYLYPFTKSRIVGFVPTMGALHQGHLSLVELSNNICDITVVSIYVNPAQFNDPQDFNKYPRTIETDLNHLDNNDVDVVFLPQTEEIYPVGFNPDYSNLDLGFLCQTMESKHRPGHFDGVIKVVDRLINIVRPDKMILGRKDYQQFLIVKNFVNQLQYPTEVVSSEIVREKDGLAMSSRNVRLSENDRDLALGLSRSLNYINEHSGTRSFNELRAIVIEKFLTNPIIRLEYLDLAEAVDLSPAMDFGGTDKIVCIAAYIGEVRLIDNILVKV
ncbi:MAG: pantoate--beta-alanine ligase [Chitinophagales bacterium]|nr:pantoate--beta-alanine ligase [Chitinophagales bacterium]